MPTIISARRFVMKLPKSTRKSLFPLNTRVAGRSSWYYLPINKIIAYAIVPVFLIICCTGHVGIGPYDLRGATLVVGGEWQEDEQQPQNSDMEMQSQSTIGFIVDTMMAHILGAVTSRNSVLEIGNCEIDGREYDSTGYFGELLGPGISGVYTCETVKTAVNATIGGNGIAPDSKAAINEVCIENAPGEPFFHSPEAFLGVVEGSLGAYKISLPELADHFDGIVYVTEDVKYTGVGSRGILIIHNESFSATLEAVDGDFKGLIICDGIGRMNNEASILGAVVILNPKGRSLVGCGRAKIHYSPQVLRSLEKYFSTPLK